MMLTLVASDGARFEIEKEFASQSQLLSNLLIDLGESNQPIPLQNVSGAILAKVIEYMRHHKDDTNISTDQSISLTTDTSLEDGILEWDLNFMKMDQGSLFEIILAANYLDLKPLLDLGCKTVANMIKSKSVEEIRRTFNVQNDFTPDEEDAIRREFDWCED